MRIHEGDENRGRRIKGVVQENYGWMIWRTYCRDWVPDVENESGKLYGLPEHDSPRFF